MADHLEVCASDNNNDNDDINDDSTLENDDQYENVLENDDNDENVLENDDNDENVLENYDNVENVVVLANDDQNDIEDSDTLPPMKNEGRRKTPEQLDAKRRPQSGRSKGPPGPSQRTTVMTRQCSKTQVARKK